MLPNRITCNKKKSILVKISAFEIRAPVFVRDNRKRHDTRIEGSVKRRLGQVMYGVVGEDKWIYLNPL